MVNPCWRSPSVEGDGGSMRQGKWSRNIDNLLCYRDLVQHLCGDFSIAVAQANNLLQDQCQIETGPLCSNGSCPPEAFIGVYGGHGGPETSRLINHSLFCNIKKFTSENRGMSENVIKKAFSATEEDFLALVKKQWEEKPQIASVGSCCLVGVVHDGNLYVGNAGDSRAVLGRLDQGSKRITPFQLSTEHNANILSIRDELRSLHPEDPNIVMMKHQVWRVKGLIQVSRSIGDAYLKRAEFNREPLLAKFRLRETFKKPILSAEPSVHVHRLEHEDRFVIFASDGLWEHLSNEEAVNIVHSNPRNGIARTLVKAAMKVAASKREMRYSDLKKINRGIRRHFHDDITSIVMFLQPQSSFNKASPLSIKSPM